MGMAVRGRYSVVRPMKANAFGVLSHLPSILCSAN